MPQALATAQQVENALRNLTKPRALRVQKLAQEHGRDKLPGELLLALGMRETWLRNILGGAKFVGGRWFPLDPTEEWDRMDAGAFQISKRYHPEALKEMEAVRAGTWEPVIEDANAYQRGMVPTFRVAIPFVLQEMSDSLDYARERGVLEQHRKRFAVAAHNAGKGGALTGYRNNNVDQRTAGGDYSAWVLDAEKKVAQFIATHPTWQYEA